MADFNLVIKRVINQIEKLDTALNLKFLLVTVSKDFSMKTMCISNAISTLLGHKLRLKSRRWVISRNARFLLPPFIGPAMPSPPPVLSACLYPPAQMLTSRHSELARKKFVVPEIQLCQRHRLQGKMAYREPEVHLCYRNSAL